MSTKLSVEDVLANLERRAADHREQEAFHAQREADHGEQRAFHASELASVLRSLESFRAVAAEAVGLVREEEPSAPAQPEAEAPVQEEELPPPGRLMVGRLLRRIAMSPSLPEPFWPKAVAAEANRRFGDRLPGPIGTRTASDVLRQMRAEGQIQLARKGKAVHEALYTRRQRG